MITLATNSTIGGLYTIQILITAVIVWLIIIRKTIKDCEEQRYYDEERRHLEILQAIRESRKAPEDSQK